MITLFERLKQELSRYEYIEKPTIGESYVVPCINNNVLDKDAGIPLWMPVLPNIHADKSFSKYARELHFHYDLRFFDWDLLMHLTDQYEYNVNQIMQIGLLSIDDFDFRIFRCEVDYFGIKGNLMRKKEVENQLKFYSKMIGTDCSGGICPHYGVPMLTRPDGKYECPYHGLIGDPETNEIVSSVPFEIYKQELPLISDVLIKGLIEKYGK